MCFPRGRTPNHINHSVLTESLTMTLMCRIGEENEPVYYELRRKSNTSWDFLFFLETSVRDGYLRRGDILIMDNWKGHCAEQTRPRVEQLLRESGVTIKWLPKYSPELNPCEFIFGQMKKHLKWRQNNDRFIHEVVCASATVERENVENYYRKCKLYPLCTASELEQSLEHE